MSKLSGRVGGKAGGRAGPLRSGVLAAVLSVAACATTSHTLIGPARIGPARAPLSPDDVRLYTEPLTGKHEDIAILQTSSRLSLAFTGDAQFAVVIDRLRQAAAKLGANGLVIEDLTNSGGSLGAGVAPDVTRDHAQVGIGLSFSGLFSSRRARATAVYVDPP